MGDGGFDRGSELERFLWFPFFMEGEPCQLSELPPSRLLREGEMSLDVPHHLNKYYLNMLTYHSNERFIYYYQLISAIHERRKIVHAEDLEVSLKTLESTLL